MTVVTPSLCSRKCALKIDHLQVKESATYAVLLTGSGDNQGARLPSEMFSGGAHPAQSDGGDICVTTADDGTGRRSLQVVGTIGSNTAELWTDVPLNPTSDVTIYVRYGSNSGTLTQPAASDTYGSQAVWDANYLGVWHLEESSSPHYDSTSNAHNTSSDTNVTQAAGKIGYGQSYNGSSSLTNVGTDSHFNFTTGLFTVSYWADISSVKSQSPISRGLWDTDGWYHTLESGGGIYLVTCVNGASSYIGTADSTYSTGKHHIVLTRTGTTTGTIHYDGSQKTTTGSLANAATSTRSLRFGRYSADGLYFHGTLDEIRISNTNRTSDYSKTDYNIQSSTDFIEVGTPGDAVAGNRRLAILSGGGYGDGVKTGGLL
jgi:hypothetical protein